MENILLWKEIDLTRMEIILGLTENVPTLREVVLGLNENSLSQSANVLGRAPKRFVSDPELSAWNGDHSPSPRKRCLSKRE